MTLEKQVTTNIDVGKLIGSVERFRNEGYRLVQIGCTKVGDLYEINYSFDLNYQFKNLRIVVDGKSEISSISGIYWGAFVYENETHDLFGIPITGINIDFKGTFIKSGEKFPFSVTRRGGDQCRNV